LEAGKRQLPLPCIGFPGRSAEDVAFDGLFGLLLGRSRSNSASNGDAKENGSKPNGSKSKGGEATAAKAVTKEAMKQKENKKKGLKRL
jgi:hypothetical protein